MIALRMNLNLDENETKGGIVWGWVASEEATEDSRAHINKGSRPLPLLCPPAQLPPHQTAWLGIRSCLQ